MVTGTGPAHCCQSQARRHTVGRHSSPLRQFLVFCSTYRAQGQQVASTRQLQTTNLWTIHDRLSMTTPTNFSVVPSSPRLTWSELTIKSLSILTIYRRPPLPLHSAYLSSTSCPSSCANPPRHSNASWTFCGTQLPFHLLRHPRLLQVTRRT